MRVKIWLGGLKGFLVGAGTGFVGFRLAHVFEDVRKMKLEHKHRFASPLLFGSFFAFVGALTEGRNHMHSVHYVMHKYSTPQTVSEYQQKMYETTALYEHDIRKAVDSLDSSPSEHPKNINPQEEQPRRGWFELPEKPK